MNELLTIYSDDFPMLKQEMPEYVGELPNEEMTELVQAMKRTMIAHGGVGLAANQCGIEKRVFIMGVGEPGDENIVALINPKIIGNSGLGEKFNEGCLSSPGLFIPIKRPSTIAIEYTDELGEIQQRKITGLTSRIFQHELDHLNGIRMQDKVSQLVLAMAIKKRKKLIRQFNLKAA